MSNTAVLWVPISAHETGIGIGHVTQFPLGNHIYRPWTLQGSGLFREESGTEIPNRGMSGGATQRAGSQGVTVPNLTHPQPTFNMGRDKGGVLSLI
jgi:hypothetical protein